MVILQDIRKVNYDRCGEDYIRLTSFGECFCTVTIEEMYQHFKSRMKEESMEEELR